MEIDNFYLTDDISQAAPSYVSIMCSILSLDSKNAAITLGLDWKSLPTLNGSLWQEVYRDGDTVIYKVNEANL